MNLYFTDQHKSNFETEDNKEIQECEIDRDHEGEEKTVEIHDLEMEMIVGEPAQEILNVPNNPNLSPEPLSLIDLPANVAEEVRRQISSMPIMSHDRQEGGREMVLQKSGFQAPQHHEDLKIATKVACLVISVSTTAIFSFLAELSREQTGRARRKLLFKSGLLLMCASFFLALVLLILSLLRLKFSCSILMVRGTMWASAGLMALSFLMLLSYYFPAS